MEDVKYLDERLATLLAEAPKRGDSGVEGIQEGVKAL